MSSWRSRFAADSRSLRICTRFCRLVIWLATMLLPAGVLDIVTVFRDVLLSMFVESKFDDGGQMMGWTGWGICERIGWGNIGRRLARPRAKAGKGASGTTRVTLIPPPPQTFHFLCFSVSFLTLNRPVRSIAVARPYD